MSKNNKKANKPVAATATSSVEYKKDNKLTMFVCIFVSAVLLIGIVFGTIFAVRSANSAMEYDGTRMSVGVANYFASYAKAYYLNVKLANVKGAEDTAKFWNTPEMGTKTYGEGMEEYVKYYLTSIVVGCYLYDSVARLSADAKQTIKKSAEGRLLYIADGNKSEFNETVKEFGFDYNDFYDATEMMYKAIMAPYVLYGAGGSALKNDTVSSDEFYNAAYKRVKLLFIRTSKDFALDDDGKRLVDDQGVDKLFELTPTEIAERESDIASIKEAIANIESDSDGQMSSVSFELYLDKYKATNMYLDPDGEYYAADAEYTSRAYEEFEDVVTRALIMPKNSYATVEIDGLGVCFLYRCELVPGAYTDTDEEGPFSDFYADLSGYKYNSELESRYGDVRIRDKFESIDLINLPSNGMYTIGM